MKIAFILFAKPPILGCVKTRLAHNLGDKTTLKFYQLMLRWQWDNFKNIINQLESKKDIVVKLKFSLFIFLAKPFNLKKREVIATFKFLPSIKKLKFEEQKGADLGSRLADAFGMLKKKKFNFILIWGSDIPSLTQYDIEKALKYRNSACLIPAMDGGYSLIGINSNYFQKELFENIIWSSKKTFSMQKKRFNDLKIPVHIMDAIPDLDTIKDIIKNILYMQKFNEEVYKDRLALISSFFEDETKSLSSQMIGRY